MIDQPNTPEDPQQGVKEEGLLEVAVSVITQPVATLRTVTQQQNLAWAFIVTVVLALASSLTSAASFDPSGPSGGPGFPWRVDPSIFRVWALGGALVLGPLIGIVSLAVVAGILQIISMILGGKGTYKGLFCGLAFASIPSIIGTPFNLLPLALGLAGEVLSGLVSFALFIWTAVLTVIVIRENNQFSTGRALAVFLIPMLAIVVFVVLLALLVAVLVISIVSST